MKNLKPVPADKKKSLGKLPTDVRNKMGYAQKGKMMSKRDKLIEKQNPKSEYKKDKFGKTKLSYTEAKKGKMVKDEKPKEKPKKPGQIFIELKTPMKARYGTMAKGNVSEALQKEKVKKDEKQLTRRTLVKRLREAQVGPAEEAKVNKMTKIEMDKKLASMPKKAKGGEMKQGYGAARTSGMGLQDEDLIPGKSMDYYKDLM